MSAAQLELLLTKGAVVGDRVRRAVSLCDAWFAAEPSLTTFVLRSIFRDLSGAEWDAPQGVETSKYKPFEDGVLPRLKQVVNILSTNPGAEPTADLDELVRAYRDFCLAGS
jgi:hypothetical protein